MDRDFSDAHVRIFLCHAGVCIVSTFMHLCSCDCCHWVGGGGLLSNILHVVTRGASSPLSLSLCVFFWLACPSGVGQRGAQWTTADLVYFHPPLTPSLSDDTGGPLVPWLTPSVSSHQLHWQLSIKCLARVVTGGSIDRQSLYLCVFVCLHSSIRLAF